MDENLPLLAELLSELFSVLTEVEEDWRGREGSERWKASPGVCGHQEKRYRIMGHPWGEQKTLQLVEYFRVLRE